jgi:hypothetical protein
MKRVALVLSALLATLAVIALLKGQFAPDRDGTRNIADPS